MRSLITIIAVVLTVCSSPARAARVLEHYDIDSLVYLSDAIGRFEVGDSEQFKTVDGDCLVHEVRVLDSLNGSLRVGSTVRITGLDEFHYAPGIAGRADSWDIIGKGETVYLFLVPNGSTGYAKYRLTNANWTVTESGARLLGGQNVYSFGQYLPGFRRDHLPVRAAAGGFVAMTEATFPGAPVQSRQAFEDRLKRSPETIARFNGLLTADATPQLAEEMIAVLKARSASLKKEMATSDALGVRLATRLTKVADPADVVPLLGDVVWDAEMALEDGLQGQSGRSYLLERVADPKEIRERRVKFARILSGAGWTYVRDIDKSKKGDIKPFPIDFATRLAHVAVDNLGTDLCEPLLSGIEGCATMGHASDEPLVADLEAAANVLSAAFPKAAPADQDRIAATLMRVSPKHYRRLLGFEIEIPRD